MDKVANLKSRPSEGFFIANPKYKQNIYLLLKCANWRIITYITLIKDMTALAEWRVSYGLETWQIEFVFFSKLS